MPAPRLANILELSKCMIQLEYASYSFREFGFSPFGNEVVQNLRLNGSPWLVGYVEWEELDGPFCNPASNVVVVYNVIKRSFGGYCYQTLLKVVSQLPGCHEHRVCYLLIMRVP